MTIKTKKLIATVLMCCMLFVTTAYAGVWGTVTTKGYTGFTTAQKLTTDNSATIKISQGAIENKCELIAYLRRVDNTSYKSEPALFHTCGTKTVKYDDDNYYYGNYYHNFFQIRVIIDCTSAYTVNTVGGTFTP